MKKIFLTTLFVFVQFYINAQPIQQPNKESLYKTWKDKNNTDSARCKAMTTLIGIFGKAGQPDSVLKYADEFYTVSKTENFKQGTGKSLSLKGFAYQMQSDYDKALEYYEQALKIYEDINDPTNIEWCISSIATIYSIRGNNEKAITYYQKSLQYSKNNPDQRTRGGTFMHIARIYQGQGEHKLAINYLEKALKIGLKSKSTLLLTNCYGALSTVYQSAGNHSKAAEYRKRGKALANKIDDIPAQIQFLGASGISYLESELYEEAKHSFMEFIQLAKANGDQLNEAKGKIGLGNTFIKLKNNNSALKNCKEGLNLAEKNKNIDVQRDACNCLFKIYNAIGNSKDALVYHIKMTTLDDSLNEIETAKKLQTMEFGKQLLADSLIQAKKDHMVKTKHVNTRNALLGTAFFILLIAGGVYSRLHFVRKSKATLQIEKERSESLLLNILPAEIAEELKEKGKADARHFDLVSILFTDFKGFTEQSAKLSAAELVYEINHCFEAFDGIIEKYNIEKIKTIGDAYMAAGGLPEPTEDSVKNTILAALEMQAFITKLHKEKQLSGERAFEMRVGIHTGPVVAGIVGIKKFQYDIWGDAVNTAARTESNGEVGKVNISQATYDLLRDDTDFTFEHRGQIAAKGKGEIDMWFVQLKK